MWRYIDITVNTAPLKSLLTEYESFFSSEERSRRWTSTRATRDSVLAQPGSPLGQRRSVCARGVTGITETPGSYAACTLPAPPARGTACRCWRVSTGCTGCDDAARRESRAPNTGPRMTTSIPRSPAAFLQDTREWWGLLAKSVVWKQSFRRTCLFMWMVDVHG